MNPEGNYEWHAPVDMPNGSVVSCVVAGDGTAVGNVLGNDSDVDSGGAGGVQHGAYKLHLLPPVET